MLQRAPRLLIRFTLILSKETRSWEGVSASSRRSSYLLMINYLVVMGLFGGVCAYPFTCSISYPFRLSPKLLRTSEPWLLERRKTAKTLDSVTRAPSSIGLSRILCMVYVNEIEYRILTPFSGFRAVTSVRLCLTSFIQVTEQMP